MDAVRFTGPDQRYGPCGVGQSTAGSTFPSAVRGAVAAAVAGLSRAVVQVRDGDGGTCGSDTGRLSRSPGDGRGVRLAKT